MSVPIPLSTRFSDWVVPQLSSSVCFGSKAKIVSHGIDCSRQGEDQFSSLVQFFDLKIQENNSVRNCSVVVKFQPDNEVLRESLRAKEQFFNEVLMYSEILPLLDRDGIVGEIFCNYYCGLAEPNLDYDKDFVVLEDLTKKGFTLTKEKVFLDYDHCVLALKEIGRFHALSHAAKANKKAEFMAAVSKIKEKWSDERVTKWRYMLSKCGERGVKPLLDNKEYENVLKRFLKNYDDPVKFFSSLVEPLDDEAVLCHGDFCRNNMLFSYDEAGKPKAVKFFDLQTPRYTSPVIDLSFFLLMNTNQETRDKYWDEFINVYKESVKSVVPNIIVPDLDFPRVGIYGYLHCSFFLPMMLTENAGDLPLDTYLSCSPYEQGNLLSSIGGEKETNYLVDIIRFLLNKNYIRESYF